MGFYISVPRRYGLRLAALAVVVLLGGCGGGAGTAQLVAAGPAGLSAQAPSLAEMQVVLHDELARLQLDTSRESTAAPSPDSAVFDLAARAIEPGEAWPESPAGIRLSWTERLLGDFNQDGLVNVSDLTPLGQHYGASVDYVAPELCDGLTCWPQGDPDGDGAANWRLARVDGNGDGLVYLTDITTIAQHWGEQLSGYRLYHKNPGEEEYRLEPNPVEPESQLTVTRVHAVSGSSNAPVRYSLLIEDVMEGEHQFYLAGCGAAADVEGTPSPMLILDYVPVGDPDPDPDPTPSGDLLVIRDDGDEYSANYDAIISDLDELEIDYWEVDWYAGIPEDFSADDWDAVIWYRGGPGNADEAGQLATACWTDDEIDDYIQLMKDGHRLLLMSQSHGRNIGVDFATESYGDGWDLWYADQVGWELLDGTIANDDIRHPWAAGLGTDKGIGLTGTYGFLESAPRNILATGEFGGRVPEEAADLGAEADNPAERYSGTGSSGDVPDALSFGPGSQFTAVGYFAPFMKYHPYPNAGPWFRSGFCLAQRFEESEERPPSAPNTYDLAFVSYGNDRAPGEDIGPFVTPNHVEGPGRLWVIGYPWAQTTITESDSGEMTRAQMLLNVLAWLMSDD